MGIDGTVICTSHGGDGALRWCLGLQQALLVYVLLVQVPHGLPGCALPVPLLQSLQKECCAVSFIDELGVLFVSLRVMWARTSLLVPWPSSVPAWSWWSPSVVFGILTLCW